MEAETWVCGLLADYRGLIGEGCVGLDRERGVIAAISKSPPPGARAMDYRSRGVLVIPGLVDLHVHLRGLGYSYKETPRSGGWAAASAGITLVVDMPNTQPPSDEPGAVEAKLGELASQCPVDHGLYAGVPERPELVGGLASTPVAGFKVYPRDLASRREALQAILSLRGMLVVLHPEAPWARRGDLQESPASRESHRPCWLEAHAVLDLASLGGRARIHVTHASCPGTVEASRALGFTVDVTPHHLHWSLHTLGDPCLGKVNPPLRGHPDVWGLWRALLEGRVDALASDHAPHAEREKLGDPLACPPGFPWLELWPWLVFRLVRLGILGLREFLWLTSRGPALVLGLRHYGTLEQGARANVVVLDPKPWRRFPGPRHSLARLTPALMERLAGAPLAVLVGGDPVYVDGEPAGRGRPVNPFASRARASGVRGGGDT